MSDVLERSLDEIIGGGNDDVSLTRPRGPRAPRGPRGSRDSRDTRDTRRRFEPSRLRENPRERIHKGSNFRERYEPPRRTRLQKLSRGQSYLKITNLHYEVTKEDLIRLFETVGDVSFATIDFDHSGRSTGVAYIGFKNNGLNHSALEKFDGRKAVGQIIAVEEIKPLNVLSVSDKPDKHPRAERKRKPTTEDLDKELDSYMNAANTSSEVKGKQTVEDLDKELDDYMNKPFPIA